MKDRLKQGLGNWVDGERFFNREAEMDVFLRYLRDGVSLLLVAPRRIGKTSFMREAGRILADTAVVLHVDLQKAISPEEAIVELGLACKPYEPLWGKAAGVFSDLVGKLESIKLSEVSVTLRSGVSSDTWQRKGDALAEVLAETSKNAKKPVIVFLDEVPILVNRILKGPEGDSHTRVRVADQFMSWLRDNTLRHKGQVVFVLTGSIGLEPVLRTAGLSGTINALHAFELGAWKPDVAALCLLALAKEKDFPLPAPVAERMIGRLGWAIPHHVQMYFDHVYNEYVFDEKNGEVETNFVDEVYDRRMTGLRGHAELAHMDERLRLILSDKLYELALTLLTEAAVVGHLSPEASSTISKQLGCAREEMLETLNILEHDGYLKKNGNGFKYQSNLMADWWKNRFGHGYIPAK